MFSRSRVSGSMVPSRERNSLDDDDDAVSTHFGVTFEIRGIGFIERLVLQPTDKDPCSQSMPSIDNRERDKKSFRRTLFYGPCTRSRIMLLRSSAFSRFLHRRSPDAAFRGFFTLKSAPFIFPNWEHFLGFAPNPTHFGWSRENTVKISI